MENKHVLKVFASRIRALREEKCLSQGDLAKVLGVSRGSISYYENAERTAGIDFAHEAAVFFSVSVDYLLGKSNLRVADADAESVSAYTGLSDRAVSNLNSLKESGDNKKILDVLNLLIEHNPPPPSPEEFASSVMEGHGIDQRAYLDARYKWKTENALVLSKMAEYLALSPNEDKNKVIEKYLRDEDNGNIIEEYGIVSQMYLNVIGDAVRKMKDLLL